MIPLYVSDVWLHACRSHDTLFFPEMTPMELIDLARSLGREGDSTAQRIDYVRSLSTWLRQTEDTLLDFKRQGLQALLVHWEQQQPGDLVTDFLQYVSVTIRKAFRAFPLKLRFWGAEYEARIDHLVPGLRNHPRWAEYSQQVLTAADAVRAYMLRKSDHAFHEPHSIEESMYIALQRHAAAAAAAASAGTLMGAGAWVPGTQQQQQHPPAAAAASPGTLMGAGAWVPGTQQQQHPPAAAAASPGTLMGAGAWVPGMQQQQHPPAAAAASHGTLMGAGACVPGTQQQQHPPAAASASPGTLMGAGAWVPGTQQQQQGAAAAAAAVAGAAPFSMQQQHQVGAAGASAWTQNGAGVWPIGTLSAAAAAAFAGARAGAVPLGMQQLHQAGAAEAGAGAGARADRHQVCSGGPSPPTTPQGSSTLGMPASPTTPLLMAPGAAGPRAPSLALCKAPPRREAFPGTYHTAEEVWQQIIEVSAVSSCACQCSTLQYIYRQLTDLAHRSLSSGCPAACLCCRTLRRNSPAMNQGYYSGPGVLGAF